MGESIIISTLVGVISNLIYDLLKRKRSPQPIPGTYREPKRGPRWFLLLFSVVPGFMVGSLLALAATESGMISGSEIFSPSFYVFIGTGSVISYAFLKRIFSRV